MNVAKVYVGLGQHGMPTGTYCVWVWPTGEVELMFKPTERGTFLPAITLTEESQ